MLKQRAIPIQELSSSLIEQLESGAFFILGYKIFHYF